MADMRDLMQDDARVYEATLRDIHQPGRVLYREKYRHPAYRNRLLLAGLSRSVLAALAGWLRAA